MNDTQTSNRLHYNYAHVALRILALGSPRKFYKDVSSRNSRQYLISIWHGLAGKMGVSRGYEGLNVLKKVLHPETEIFIIQLPRPTVTPEAFYIGVAFQIKKKLSGTEVLSARYFTLELGKNIYDQTEEYHFCEWVGVIDPQHLNRGRLSNSNEQTFIDAIESVLLSSPSINEINKR